MVHETAGDPVSGLKWTRRTTAKIPAGASPGRPGVCPALSTIVARGLPSGEIGSDATSPAPAGVRVLHPAPYMHPICNLKQEILQ